MDQHQQDHEGEQPAESGASSFSEEVSRTPWQRVVTKRSNGMSLSYTEYLDREAAMQRLYEVMLHRGDSGLSNWIDHILDGTHGDLTPKDVAA